MLLSYSFGEALPVPALNVTWEVSDHFRLAAVLPSALRFEWKPLNVLIFGVKGALNGNRYVTTSALIPSARQLAYSEANLTAYVDLNLHKPLWLSIYGGSTVFRRFELFNDAGESLGDRDIDNAPVMGVSLSVRDPGGPRAGEEQ